MTRKKNSKTAVDHSATGVAVQTSDAIRMPYVYKSREEKNSLILDPRESTMINASEARPAYTTSELRPDYSTSGVRSGYSPSGTRQSYASSEICNGHASLGPRPIHTSMSPRLSLNASSTNRQNYSKQDPRQYYASSTTSSNVGDVENSVVSFATTSSSSHSKDKALIKKKKNPVKVKVSYVTKQIEIQPRHPILTVERLKNLEHHVDMLTVTLGRCPKVYKHGKCVRFVSETYDEYKAIQRYLTKIETQEKIVWCSYSVPPGNSLKVNEKVRVVERIKIADELKNLKLNDNTKALDSKQTDVAEQGEKSVASNKKKDNKTTKPSSKDVDVNVTETTSEVNKIKLGNSAIHDKLSTSNQKQNDKKSIQKQGIVRDKPVLNISAGHEDSKKRQSADVTKQGSLANIGNDRKAMEATKRDTNAPILKSANIGNDKKLNYVSIIRTQKMF